ncbi:hypothetical protein D3C81_2072560 [compost metagenome]
MRHGTQVIHFVRRNLFDQAVKVRAVRQVTIMQSDIVTNLTQMIDTRGVIRGGTTN